MRSFPSKFFQRILTSPAQPTTSRYVLPALSIFSAWFHIFYIKHFCISDKKIFSIWTATATTSESEQFQYNWQIIVVHFLLARSKKREANMKNICSVILAFDRQVLVTKSSSHCQISEEIEEKFSVVIMPLSIECCWHIKNAMRHIFFIF